MSAGIKVSVESLRPATKEGFLQKQGSALKIWKTKWFVLKDKNLFYFKHNKSAEPSGMVVLGEEAKITIDAKRNTFNVVTYQRVLILKAISVPEMNDWVNKLHNAKKDKGDNNNNNDQKWQQADPTPVVPKKISSAKEKLLPVKQCIPYLKEEKEKAKIVEFWDIWIDSIPTPADLYGATLDLQVATSASFQKMTWRMAGPQASLVQKMVDFFFDVGAPESEIDRLNDVGGFIQPAIIGSWIDMSAKGGMDGGWFFRADMPVSNALEASDPGHTSRTVLEWTARHKITNCYLVGRDMGSSPPRQTEIRVEMPGSFDNQLRIVMDAFDFFNLPPISPKVKDVIELAEPENPQRTPLCLSIIISSVGFVRVGILIPKPIFEVVRDLCALAPEVNLTNQEYLSQITVLESSLNSKGPEFIECQYIVAGFGYSVYQEGFDVVLHYNAPN